MGGGEYKSYKLIGDWKEDEGSMMGFDCAVGGERKETRTGPFFFGLAKRGVVWFHARKNYRLLGSGPV